VIAADPDAPVVVGVQGVGGQGKTTLLRELSRIYRDAGVQVVDGASEPVDAPERSAVLVDDAHRLDDDVVRRLAEIAGKPGARLVVAYRPWPRSAAMGELVTVLGRVGSPVVLGGLSDDEVAHLATRTLGAGVPQDAVDRLQSLTGGVARLVVRALAAPNSWRTGEDQRFPRSVLDQFHHDMDQLDTRERDCLTAVAVGATPHPAVLAALLGLDQDAVGTAMAAVRASGLLDADDALVPIARQAVLLLTPVERRLAVLRRLLSMQLQRGGPVVGLVRPLLGVEIALTPDPTMAAAFEKGGDEALARVPSLAAQLYSAAVSAGAEAKSVAARRAHAAAASGCLDEALRLADQVIVDDSVDDRALGARVAATVLAHRGLLARTGELCAWSVEQVRWSGDRAFAVIGLIAAGRLDEAEDVLRGPGDPGPPTSLSGAAVQLAEGVLASVTGASSAALSTLVRAAALSEAIDAGLLLPDTPAAVAAAVAMHCGEFDVAASMMDRADEAGTGGPLLRARHRLLSAWVPLLRGDTVAARSTLSTVAVDRLGARDALVAVAIEAGIASRENDVATLAEVRGRARKAVAEHPVDLFSLLPLGELAVAMTRLHDQDWLSPYLREAHSLLGSLGNPPLWSSPLHWRRLQAALVLDDREAVREHGDALAAMAGYNPLCSAMADAARVWASVLDGRIEHEEAESAARGLHSAGLGDDGARLAGQAAVRTTDRRAMLALLECARALQGKAPRPRAVAGPAETKGGSSGGTAPLLSDREREVAELVVSGMTYKQVGTRLFISAKTVEHHIGRIKQRLGCANREDLLGRLREMLGRE
jgi:DNA-binding CsgD family transcriptional regulator